MLNNCLLTGNLGADPEVFYSSEGDPIATFNLAFRSSKKKTNWIKITCFNKLAEITEKYLHKGARIGIIGTLDQQKWETDEGARRSNFQLIANSIEFIKTDGIWFAVLMNRCIAESPTILKGDWLLIIPERVPNTPNRGCPLMWQVSVPK